MSASSSRSSSASAVTAARARAPARSGRRRWRPRRRTPPGRSRPHRACRGGRPLAGTPPPPPRLPCPQCRRQRAFVPARLSPQGTSLGDGCELLRLRQGALQTAVAIRQLVLQAVDRLLVAKALDADPLELGLELLDAVLACSHLAAQLLQLPAQLLQPCRLRVE